MKANTEQRLNVASALLAKVVNDFEEEGCEGCGTIGDSIINEIRKFLESAKIKTIEYGDHGEAIPDHNAEQRANGFLRSNSTYICVSNENFIYAVRVLIKERVINHKQITFLFRGQLLQPNADGRLEEWPEGFGQIMDVFLRRLI